MHPDDAAGGLRLFFRMYRQGLGDCLLLRFEADDRSVHMLVDCGVLLGTDDAATKMKEVAEDIERATAGHIDVLVATHEHWDHLSGFLQAKEVFDRITIDEIWLAWTEDPGNELAQQLRHERARRLEGLRLALERWKAAGVQPAFHQGVADVVEFFGDPLAAGKGQTTADALAYLTNREDARIRYLHPGEPPRSISGVSGIRAFVLGPPEDERFIRKSNPTKKGQEVYGLLPSPELGFFAAVRDSASQGTQPTTSPSSTSPGDRRLTDPFDPYFRIPVEVARGHTVFAQYYDAGEEWRGIDDDWLTVAGPLALALDNDTNNTCVALAIELGPDGPVILLPGDAQVGNWESWQEVSWKLPERADGTVTAKDLLARTVLYKVGHHGSHNATLRTNGLELMESPDLVAMIPVNRDMAKKRRWNMPFPPLLARLKEKCRGRVLAIDAPVPDAKDPGLRVLNQREISRFLEAVTPERLYLELRVPM